MKERIQELAREFERKVTGHRRHLHAHPEPSFGEEKTAAYIRRELDRCGVPHTGISGCHCVIGRIKGEKPGKTVAFRADIDALCMTEQGDTPYRSQSEGLMHACGHDGHTAALLGLAELLAAGRDLVCGEVVLLFQHAEELPPGGAKALVEHGVLDGVDAVVGAHLWTPFAVGTVGYHSGAIMAAADRFTVTLTGQGGHGSEPQNTDDVLLLGAAIVQQLQAVVSRRTDPRDPVVLSVCQFHAGSAFNVIPGRCELGGTVRTFDETTRKGMEEQVRRVAESLAGAVPGVTCEVDYVYGYPAVCNDKTLTGLVAGAVRDGTAYNTEEMQAVMGGDDFAYFGGVAPSVYLFVGAGNAAQGFDQPHHSPTFDFDERALQVLLEVYLASYLRIVERF